MIKTKIKDFLETSLIGKKIFIIYRRIKRFRLSDAAWKADQIFRFIRMKLCSERHVQSLREDLTNDLIRNGKPVISILLISRQFGNRDNHIKRFFKSFLEMTEDPNKIEIVIKVDDDDDLIFFHEIKRKYSCAFAISKRGEGYMDFHRYFTEAYERRHRSSRIVFIMTEDIFFVRKSWEKDILAIKNKYFIAGSAPFNFVVGTIPDRFGSHIGGADYWIMSVELAECLKKATKEYGWTPFGNSNFTPLFLGDIIRLVWEKYNINLYVQIPEAIKRYGMVKWQENKTRYNQRKNLVLHFKRQENQDIRDKIAEEVRRLILEEGMKKEH